MSAGLAALLDDLAKIARAAAAEANEPISGGSEQEERSSPRQSARTSSCPRIGDGGDRLTLAAVSAIARVSGVSIRRPRIAQATARPFQLKDHKADCAASSVPRLVRRLAPETRRSLSSGHWAIGAPGFEPDARPAKRKKPPGGEASVSPSSLRGT